jgi:signal peptidase II
MRGESNVNGDRETGKSASPSYRVGDPGLPRCAIQRAMIARAYRLVLLVSLVLLSAGCDQWTKYHAVASLTQELGRVEGLVPRVAHYLSHAHPTPQAAITVVDGFFRFTYAENPGAAFSFLAGVSFGRWLLVALGAIAVAFFFAWALRTRGPLSFLGASLILGGALGNLFDRVRLGYVVDFVEWHYRDRVSWPIFNVADVWIFVGAVLLAISVARASRVERAPTSDPAAETF